MVAVGPAEPAWTPRRSSQSGPRRFERVTTDAWQSGDGYESYVGRWSRPVADVFIRGLGIPFGGRWVDVGCGTGAVTETILRLADPASVVGIDPSEAFVAFARAHVVDDRARFAIGDGDALPLSDHDADVAVSGLVLNFVPDPVAMLAEMRRVTRPGGMVGDLRLGLRRRHGTDAPLLGRGHRAGPGRQRHSPRASGSRSAGPNRCATRSGGPAYPMSTYSRSTSRRSSATSTITGSPSWWRLLPPRATP